jgi:glycosyltransferase involved in cell wall biosynthesis
MRLTLVIWGLRSGGAERVLCRLANCWVERSHEVTLLTLYPGESFYQLDKRVRHVALGVDSASYNLLEALRANAVKLLALRKAIAVSGPDVVVSFLDTTNILTLFATLAMRAPVIVSERIDPFHNNELPRMWRLLRRVSYPLAAKVVVQTQAVLARMKPMLGKIVTTIPNPVVDPGARHRSHDASSVERQWVIGMGRLTEQKGFDLLLEAFAQIADKHVDWSLRILGDGPAFASLEQQIRNLGLEGRALLLGRISDPFPLLAESSLFVMSSRFEGFPNALCEAMACGLPVISFDCPSGPSEIIRNGVDGILLPKEDISALAETMDSLMSDRDKRKSLAAHSPEIIQRFGLERVLDEWEQLFSEVSKGL